MKAAFDDDYSSLGDSVADAPKTKKSKEAAIADILSSIDDITPYSTFLSESKTSSVNEWIDTGSMVLNALISGSLYGGVPRGRVVQFAGPSQTFKTGFILKILANAQKQGMTVVIYDTEGAIDADSAAAFGLDTSKVKYITVQTAENARNSIYKLLKKVKEHGMEGKFILAIDSLANLNSEMELNRMEKENTSADMGTFAKSIKSLLKTCTQMSTLTQTPILVTNHVYDDPSKMYPSLEQNIAGGKAAIYLPSVTIQLARKPMESDGGKTTDDSTAASQKKYAGVVIRALTVKNRFVKQYLEGQMYLSFSTGLDKRFGLLEIMKDIGVVTIKGSTYSDWNGNKLGFYKRWRKDDAVWDVLLPELERRIKIDWAYGGRLDEPEVFEDDDEDAE
jgi:RecA/RadA recombinase